MRLSRCYFNCLNIFQGSSARHVATAAETRSLRFLIGHCMCVQLSPVLTHFTVTSFSSASAPCLEMLQAFLISAVRQPYPDINMHRGEAEGTARARPILPRRRRRSGTRHRTIQQINTLNLCQWRVCSAYHTTPQTIFRSLCRTLSLGLWEHHILCRIQQLGS